MNHGSGKEKSGSVPIAPPGFYLCHGTGLVETFHRQLVFLVAVIAEDRFIGLVFKQACGGGNSLDGIRQAHGSPFPLEDRAAQSIENLGVFRIDILEVPEPPH
jgi:hypothetical protein